MNVTVLKMYFTKQKMGLSICYRNYKDNYNLKFREELNRELTKHEANNRDQEIFHEIVCFQFLMHMHH